LVVLVEPSLGLVVLTWEAQVVDKLRRRHLGLIEVLFVGEEIRKLHTDWYEQLREARVVGNYATLGLSQVASGANLQRTNLLVVRRQSWITR
jgi:hypothetical protein